METLADNRCCAERRAFLSKITKVVRNNGHGSNERLSDSRRNFEQCK